MLIKESVNYSYDLENDIIGICVLEPLTAVRVASMVNTEWFYYDFFIDCMDVIKVRLSTFQNIDLNTVVEDLVQKFQSRSYNNEKISYLLLKCTQNVISGAHIVDWVNLLEKMFIGRNLERIQYLSAENISIEERRDKIDNLLSKGKLAKVNTNWIPMGKALDNYFEYYSNNYGSQVVGLQWGMNKLDWLIGGSRPETLTLIAARPSIGKSALGMQIITEMASRGVKVGVVSIEMGNNELIARIISYKTGISFEDVYRMKVPIDRMKFELSKFTDLNINFSDETKCSIEGIRASVYKLAQISALDVLVIDYIQLMSSEAKTHTKNDEIGKISSGLKEMSRQLKIPIIALAQLNRAGANEPILENLRDGGSLEQDADVVVFLHGDRELPDREIIVAKNRNGKLGRVKSNFDGSHMKFTEIESNNQHSTF